MTNRGPLFVGIDVGGTNLRFAIVDAEGRIVRRERQPTDIHRGKESFLERLRAGIELLKRDARELDRPIKGVGAGVPGLISNDGYVHSSVNLTPIEGLNLREIVESWTQTPVVVANDANAIAYGEKEFGAGKGFASLLMYTIGTGVGSGLVLDGRLWTGFDGVAGEYGHATVEPMGRPCPCGNNGCLEQYSSASAIARTVRDAINKGSETSLSRLSVEDVTAESIAQAASNGDPVAMEAYKEAGRYLGIASATIANLLNLEAIILGGGVAASFDLLAESMHQEISRRAFAIPARRLKIIKGMLGDDAGLLGSAALAKNAL